MSEREPAPPAKPKHPFLLWLRNSFLTGIVVTAPIGATVWVVFTFVNWVDGRVMPLFPPRYNPENYLPVDVPGLGLIIAVVGLTLLGALAANIFGRTLLGFGERLLARVPFVSNLYDALKQIFQTVFSGAEKNFQDAVLIEYPRKGLWAIGFITANAKFELAERLGSDTVAVFVPTTPNPTSGFLLYEKRENLIDLDMSVEETAKLVISAGMVYPESVEMVQRAEAAKNAAKSKKSSGAEE